MVQEAQGAPAPRGGQTVALALQALQAIATTVGFVGFLVALGACLTWIRFWGAGLPPDQAIGTIDRWELVTRGTLVLIVFALAGGIAVLLAYLVDRRTSSSQSMGGAVLSITVIELLVALASMH